MRSLSRYAAVLVMLGCTPYAYAQARFEYAKPVIRANPAALTIAPRTSNRTRFDPTVHGFKFANTFANNFIPEIDVRNDGLCGGMVYAALDYFNNPSIPLPTQNYEPSEGTPLRIYLYQRQTNSIIDHNFAKWAELAVNPVGTRNAEFYRWGLQGPGGRLDKLRSEIDAGRPVPLGLKGCDQGCFGDHQALAIGYDMGAYTGDMGPALTQVKIFVYDPNFPGRTMTLQPYPEASQYRYLEPDHKGVRHSWRTYFVNEHYSKRQPPVVTQAAREIVLMIETGGDDLRGGNDNLHVHLLLRDGRTLSFENVNKGRRWVNNTEQTVAVPLPDGVARADVRGVRLETTFAGGMGGDNWNMGRLVVRGRDGSGENTLFVTEKDFMFRFTGDQKTREFIF